jgi:hypothetical protein
VQNASNNSHVGLLIRAIDAASEDLRRSLQPLILLSALRWWRKWHVRQPHDAVDELAYKWFLELPLQRQSVNQGETP